MAVFCMNAQASSMLSWAATVAACSTKSFCCGVAPWSQKVLLYTICITQQWKSLDSHHKDWVQCQGSPYVENAGLGQSISMPPASYHSLTALYPSSIKQRNSRPIWQRLTQLTQLHIITLCRMKQCAMAQAVTCRSLTTMAQVQSQPSPKCDLWWTQWHWVRFVPKDFDFPITVPPMLHSFICRSPLVHNVS
jgi:hypothetical protein